jgi:hypothetical protein
MAASKKGLFNETESFLSMFWTSFLSIAPVRLWPVAEQRLGEIQLLVNCSNET